MIVCVALLTLCSLTVLFCHVLAKGKTRPKPKSKSGDATTSSRSSKVAIDATKFQERETELAGILSHSRQQPSAVTYGGRRDALTKLAKRKGLSSEGLSGWVEMDEVSQGLMLTTRQRVLTRQHLRRACGYVKYGSPKDGPSADFLNCKCPVSGFNFLPSCLPTNVPTYRPPSLHVQPICAPGGTSLF